MKSNAMPEWLKAEAARLEKDPRITRMVRNYEAAARRGPPRLALVDSLEEGVAAVLIRDPAEERPLMVLARDRMNDNVFLSSRSMLLGDEGLVPDLTDQRILKLWTDNRLSIEYAGSVQWHDFKLDYDPDGSTVNLDRLIERSTITATGVQLPVDRKGTILRLPRTQ